MANNARVPQFGKWESDGGVPYTQFFDNARRGKNATKMINPNDPQENPEAFYMDDPPIHASPSRVPTSQVPARMNNEKRNNREDVSEHQVVNYRSTDATTTHKRVSVSPNRWHNQGNLADNQRRTSRNNGGSEHSIEQSPIHQLHIRSASKGGVSPPSREKRTSSEKHTLAPNTPGRSKTKPGDRNDNMEQHDKVSAVPKFGEWDATDPSSADGYSYIFNQVREERHNGSTMPPSISRESYSNVQRRKTNSESTDVFCFCFKK